MTGFDDRYSLPLLAGGICGACVARVSKGTIDASDIPDLEFTVGEGALGP